MPASGGGGASSVDAGAEVLIVSERAMDLLAIETALGQRLSRLRVRTARNMDEAASIADESPALRLVLMADHLLRNFAPVGVEALRTRFSGAAVAAVGIVTEAEAGQWLRQGLTGILSSRLDPDRFADALQFMMAGNRYVDPDVLSQSRDASEVCLFNGQQGLMELINRLPAPILLIFDRRVVYANEQAALVMLDGVRVQSDLPLGDFVVSDQRDMLESHLAAAESGPPPEPVLLRFRRSAGQPRAILCHLDRHALFGAGGLSCVGIAAEDDRVGEPHGTGPVGRPLALGDGPRADPAGLASLTVRQREVLQCLAEGCSNKEIAARLNISAATVKLHVHNILRGLGLANRTAAAIAARGMSR